MKLNEKLMWRASTAAIAAAAVAVIAAPVFGQELSLNYETLSSLEEPLATEVGDVTFVLTGLVDVPVTFELEGDASPDFDVTGNFQLSAETQMANQWTIGAAYFGQYQTQQASSDDDKYTDNAAAFVRGVWGQVIGGNVAGIVREETRRLRGAGNAELAFDGNYGSLDDLGGAYVGRYGPFVASTVIDEDANFELGLMFQRPLGNKDYRFTGRYAQGLFTSADGLMEFDTEAVGAVGELVYGSSRFDVGVGYEELTSSLVNADRWYVSSGVHTKVNVISLSLEGHYGEVEGQEEVSAALGARYDIARGLSANLGVNYADAPINVGGISLNTTQGTTAILSLRYSF